MGKIIKILTLIFAILFFLSYIFNYQKCRHSLHSEIDKSFQKEVPSWGDTINKKKGFPHWGRHSSNAYHNKKRTRIVFDNDTIDIARKYYYLEDYNEYCRINLETSLLLIDSYDISIADSLFHGLMRKLDIDGEVAVELHVKDLRKMFPTEDSMVHDVPVSKILQSSELSGFLTQPVGIGICNHALLYGCVDIPVKEVLTKMSKFSWLQLLIILTYLLAILAWWCYIKYFSILIPYMKNVRLIGNTCIDFNKNVVYPWSGECKPIIGNRTSILKLLLGTVPPYKLSKEDVCQKIWKRNAKDGQALYNVAISEIRTSFIADDPSLELRSLPKEGTELIIDKSKIKKWRWAHFLPIIIFSSIKKECTTGIS